MRIREIHVDGFGQFADKPFGPLERPVTVFYGPNEAGKSTLLEFVRRVLFGFPAGAGGSTPIPLWPEGRYGDASPSKIRKGRLYDVRRTTGRNYGGEVALTSGSGRPNPRNRTDEAAGQPLAGRLRAGLRVHSQRTLQRRPVERRKRQQPDIQRGHGRCFPTGRDECNRTVAKLPFPHRREHARDLRLRQQT